MKVTCEACGHDADIGEASDAWRCPCSAGLRAGSTCDCRAVNEAPGTEDNPGDPSGEIANLEARIIELRGGVRPEGHRE